MSVRQGGPEFPFLHPHVYNHKCCAQLSRYKLVVPEREVVVCSADEGQQARNSCPELRIFFLLASHGILFHVNALAGYGCLLVSLPRPNPLCQYFLNSGFGSVLAKPCGDESH